MFLGPDSLTAALPKGGTSYNTYPASLENYMDGLLKQSWESQHREENGKVGDSSHMSKAVSWINLSFTKILIKVI